MNVPFFDATRSLPGEEALLVEAFTRVLRSGRYILGAEVQAFERALAERLGGAAVVAVSSGTDALLLALLAVGAGPGDEIVVPAYGFVATAEVVRRVGATPVFCDVRRDDLNVDPAAVERSIGPRTRAIVCVHLFGAPAPIADLASFGQPIIEDAAQAFGASVGGRAVGTIGGAGCYSFFPTKNLGGFGDGGAVCANVEIAERIRRLRSHGQGAAGVFEEVGGNFRIDALHAALLGVRLRSLEARIARRREIAARYVERLASSCFEGAVTPLRPAFGATFNQFVVRIAPERASRDEVAMRLAQSGVESKVYYERALPDQPCFSGSRAGDFENARDAARTTLALPCYPELRDDEIDVTTAALAEALR